MTSPEPTTPDVDVDVLVIGAGPAGLMAATVLRSYGTSVRIVDKKTGPTAESRALVVQARTLELWKKLGLDDKALRQGQRARGAIAWLNGRPLNRGRLLFNFTKLGDRQTPFPFLLVLEQSKTERLLLEHLTTLNGAVEWSTSAEVLEQTPDHVAARITSEDGTPEHITARYVIGADGAHSPTRHALGLGFDGSEYAQTFFLADVAVAWDHGHQELYIASTETGTYLLVPMASDDEHPRFRVLGSIPESLAGKDQLDLDDIQNAVDLDGGFRAQLSDSRWISKYTLHHRLASRFRTGRVFLAGDAAHIHSPIGGQGMNTGIQDAYNIAWRLGHVTARGAAVSLLDEYEPERHQVAAALVSGTDNAFTALTSPKPRVRVARKIIGPLLPLLLRAIPPIRRRLFATVSEIGITYRHGKSRHLTAGDRAPLAPFGGGRTTFDDLTGVGYHLIVNGWPDTAAFSRGDKSLAVHSYRANRVLDARYGPQSATLVRPDGYVAWRTTDAATLRNRLESVR